MLFDVFYVIRCCLMFFGVIRCFFEFLKVTRCFLRSFAMKSAMERFSTHLNLIDYLFCDVSCAMQHDLNASNENHRHL